MKRPKRAASQAARECPAGLTPMNQGVRIHRPLDGGVRRRRPTGWGLCRDLNAWSVGDVELKRHRLSVVTQTLEQLLTSGGVASVGLSKAGFEFSQLGRR